jgi:hypothetical protein
MDATTLLLAVDSTQVNSAAAALDRMAASGDKTVSTTTQLTKAAGDQGRLLAGQLIPQANKAAAAIEGIAAADKSVVAASSRSDRALSRARAPQGQAVRAPEFPAIKSPGAVTVPVTVDTAAIDKLSTSGAKAATTTSLLTKAAGEQGRAFNEAAQGADKLTASVNALNAAEAKAPRTRRTAISDAPAATSRRASTRQTAAEEPGAVASAVERVGTTAKSTTLALVEMGDAGVAAGNKAEASLSRAARARAPKPIALGPLEGASTQLGASSSVSLERATSSLGASSFKGINDLTTSLGAATAAAAGTTRQVDALKTAVSLVGPLGSATTTRGAGGAAPAAAVVSDAAAINSFTTAAVRAETQAVELGTAFEREVARGATQAKSSVTSLTQATTTLGASSFANLDKATTSLGAVEAKVHSVTREVTALNHALELSGDLRGVTTSLGATGPRPAVTGAAVAPASAGQAAPQTAAVSAFNTEANKAAAGAKRLEDAEQALALASARSEAAQAGLTAATQRNAAAQQQLAVALNSGLASQQEIAQAQQRAATSQAAFLGAQSRATAAAQQASKAAEQHRRALASLGKQSTLTAHEATQLGFQLQDFFIQIQAGQSPLTAFIQQGSQLTGTFGSVGGALRAVMSLLTPLRVGLLGLGAGVGIFGLLAAKAEGFARSLGDVQAALAATGRGGSISDSGLADLIDQLAELPGVSREAAEKTVAELSRIKGVSTDMFLGIGTLAADYARVTGKELPDAAKELGKAFAEPEQGAKTLEDAFGSLSSTALVTIQRLVEQGDRLGASRALYEEVQRAIGGLASQGLTPLQQATDSLGNAWDRLTGSFRESDGLRNTVSEVARLVGYMKDAVEWFDRADTAWRNGPGRFMPGAARPAFSGGATGSFDAPRGATGSFGEPAASGPLGTAPKQAVGAVTQAVEEQTKAALKLAGAYDTTASKIDKLLVKRKQLSEALAVNAPGSEQAKRLTVGIAGIDEEVAGLRKRGRKDSEPEQIRRAALEADISGFQDALAKERDALAFHSRFVQGEYQAGTLSLRQFYADRRQTIADGVAAEIDELDKEKKRLAEDRDKTKDPSEARQLQGRIDAATRDQERARTRAANDVSLTNQEEGASFKALSDQVVNYRANLLQLQGDEIGAAKLRAQQAIEQASVLARQAAPASSGAFSRQDRGQQPDGGVDVAELQRVTQQNILVQQSRKTVNRVTQELQIEEERIALQLQKGSITEYESLRQVGAARRQVVAVLEEQVAAQEAVAKSRPKDDEFALSTQRARLELEKLKASLDPLAEKFDNLFRDSGASAIDDLLNGTKSFRGALVSFGDSVVKQINADTARAASDAIFGKDGVLGGAGSVFSGMFGAGPLTGAGESGGIPNPAKRGAVEVGPLEAKTASVSQSLTTLQTAGIDPTVSALARLTQAADAAAGAVSRPVTAGQVPSIALPQIVAQGGVLPTTGDLSRADRAAEQTAEATTQSAEGLTTALVDTRTNTQVFSQVMGSVAPVVASMGRAGGAAGAALALLPAIIAASSSSSTASSGGGFLSSIGSLFGSGSKPTTGDFARMDRGGESGGFYSTVASYFSSFFHTGGIVGHDKDMRAVDPGVFAGAQKYHTGGIVGGEALATLKANEVPAILLGGPKGVREEVLTAGDPRHRDNIAPILLKTIEDAKGNPSSVLSVIASGGDGGDGGAGGLGGRGGESSFSALVKQEKQGRELSPLTQFLIGSPETVSGLIAELTKEADFEDVSALRDVKRVAGARELGGPVSANSLYRVNEKGPELLQVEGKTYLMTGNQRGTVDSQPSKQAPPINVTINQSFGAETNRQTIGQAAVQTGAVVRRELARGTA